MLRDKKIYYSGLTREGERITVRFREAEQRAAALKLIGAEMPVITTVDGPVLRVARRAEAMIAAASGEQAALEPR